MLGVMLMLWLGSGCKQAVESAVLTGLTPLGLMPMPMWCTPGTCTGTAGDAFTSQALAGHTSASCSRRWRGRRPAILSASTLAALIK